MYVLFVYTELNFYGKKTREEGKGVRVGGVGSRLSSEVFSGVCSVVCLEVCSGVSSEMCAWVCSEVSSRVYSGV